MTTKKKLLAISKKGAFDVKDKSLRPKPPPLVHPSTHPQEVIQSPCGISPLDVNVTFPDFFDVNVTFPE